MFPPLSGRSEGVGPGYSVTTLAMVIVAPVIVLVVLSAVAALVFRRIHRNQMERLTARDTEYGTIDGLIASNVGDSTLAVSSSSSQSDKALPWGWGLYHFCIALHCASTK